MLVSFVKVIICLFSEAAATDPELCHINNDQTDSQSYSGRHERGNWGAQEEDDERNIVKSQQEQV